MKTKYVVIQEKIVFNRELAIETYQKLTDLRYLTGQYINMLRKTHKEYHYFDFEGMRKGVVILKSDYRDLLKSKPKFLTRLDLNEYRIDLNSDTLKHALVCLRHKLRVLRSSRKWVGIQDNIHNNFGYWMNRKLEKVYGDLTKSKIPKTEDKYVGIEIECIIPTDRDLKKLLLPYAKYVSLAEDGSIDADEYNTRGDCDCDNPEDCGESHTSEDYKGQEIRVLAKESELNDVLRGVCGVLNTIGAMVNKSCGLHVHFDMRNNDTAKRSEIYTKLFRALKLVVKIVPQSRRNNQYCKRNTSSTPRYNGSRYRMINATSYYRHSTFEIRLFNSTTNADKIINWVTLLQGIMNGSVVLRSPSTFQHAQKHWGMSNELLAWALARQEKFTTPTQDSNEIPQPSESNLETASNGALIVIPRLGSTIQQLEETNV